MGLNSRNGPIPLINNLLPTVITKTSEKNCETRTETD